MTRRTCRASGCPGSIAGDGYCDSCGVQASEAAESPPARSGPQPRRPGNSPTGSKGTLTTGSADAGGHRRRASTAGAATTRSSLGAGLVEIVPAVVQDPRAAVLDAPEVAEGKRYCASCDGPVGRSRSGRAARSSGFCPRCRAAFDFEPKLRAGDLLADQYEVAGCLAHGGLGWIYLARDLAVEGRWVVLKGLLNAGDEAAMAVAFAERRFLAQIDHGDIVKIFNFVTHGGAGYIVMEYVGGPSLNEILRQRRAANAGEADPLPPEQAIGFVLAALPAFAYLHAQGLLYCDFKPDNLIQSGDHVKLIDLGAVRRLDDDTGDLYGTVGFQAPEVPELGPSISSDLYTLGRTLAVLTLDFRGYQQEFSSSLPDPALHPVLERFESFHRFLLKATAPHPDDRFQSASEMGDQLSGVLREVVAVTTGIPRPAPSQVFGPAGEDEEIPPLVVDAADPAATFLTNLRAEGPAAVVDEIAAATASGQVAETVEVHLRRVQALIEMGDHEAAAAQIESIRNADPWDWRAVWLRGVNALRTGDHAEAAAAFDRCWSEVPGELAPKLAAAEAAVGCGDVSAAAELYGLVAAVDPSQVAAVKGLARCRAEAGDVAGAVTAYGLIPPTHRAYAAAQRDGVVALIASGCFVEAATRLDALDVDHLRRAELDVELFSAVFDALDSGGLASAPETLLAGHPLDERGVRMALEGALRRQAALAPTRAERVRIVDRANAVRPVTLR